MEEHTEREIPQPETLLAAALFLATNYAKTGCPVLRNMIIRQLALVHGHPSNALPQSIKETCGRLLAEWERIGAERLAMLHEAARAQRADGEQLH